MDGTPCALAAVPVRSRRIACLLLTVWILGLSDLSFTVWAQRFTHFHELNPLARPLVEANAFPSLVAFKVAMTAGGTGIFWLCRRRWTAEFATWFVLVTYVMLACQWSDYTQAAMVEPSVSL